MATIVNQNGTMGKYVVRTLVRPNLLGSVLWISLVVKHTCDGAVDTTRVPASQQSAPLMTYYCSNNPPVSSGFTSRENYVVIEEVKTNVARKIIQTIYTPRMVV